MLKPGKFVILVQSCSKLNKFRLITSKTFPLTQPTMPETNLAKINFECQRENELGQQWNMKIACWNVNGLRACASKGLLEYIKAESADIVCIQETKCTEKKIPDELRTIPGYSTVEYSSAAKEGYAGVAVYSKIKPISIDKEFNHDDYKDNDGRMITLEYDKFYLVNVYVPNAGRGLVTLDKRLEWNEAFQAYVKELDEKKPVIVCGDMNVAHLEIDLKNPKTNKKNAGFTQEERDGMTEFLSNDLVDSFRHFYPDKEEVYTFWTYMMNSRAKNVGWRIDYFIVSKRLMPNVCDNVIRPEVYGSDHCPIVLFLNV